MGTWGHGNLDNDYAWDDLSSRQHELVNTLLLRAQRRDSREADERDYSALFVDFEVLFAYDKAGLLKKIAMPAPAAIRALATEYIAEWEAYYQELGPSDEHLMKRRDVIADSFERLAKICETFEGQGALPSAEPKKPTKPAKPPASKKQARKPRQAKKVKSKRR